MDLVDPPVLLSSSPTSSRHIYTDDPLPSIEHDFSDTGEHSISGHNSSGPDEAVFDRSIDDDAQSSPGTSHASDDDISELPSDSRVSSCNIMEREPSVVYTPKKQRSPFRNPSSVRALQLDTTPPHLRSGSGRRQYRMSGMSNRSGTPKSVRSFHGSARTPKSSPTKTVRTEFPLVLLHVTLLPAHCPYSQETMEAVLPLAVIENWKLLREKISDTVLERGILIPHPREDYDVLEERLLESLELKVPRILKCGHFHLSPEEEEDVLASEEEYDSDEDLDICQDCGRRIRDGLYGTGSGQRRWDIKIYASNGLMRAGAWSAAWREMERVDVEILPWIEDGMRRELDLRKEEEEAAHAQSSPQQAPQSPQNMDEERRREIYGNDAQAFVDGLADSPIPSANSKEPQRQQHEPPLIELMSNYVKLLMQDRRNVVIAVLSFLVLFFALGLGRSTPLPPAIVPDNHLVMSPEVVPVEPPKMPHISAETSIVPSIAPTAEIESEASQQESSSAVVSEAVAEIKLKEAQASDPLPADTDAQTDGEQSPDDLLEPSNE